MANAPPVKAGRSHREEPWALRSGDAHFGKSDILLDSARMVALVLVLLVALGQLTVHGVDQHVDGRIEVVGGLGPFDVGAVDDNVRFGDELVLFIPAVFVAQFHVEADDALVVFEKTAHLLDDMVLECVRQFNVVSRDNDVAVHVFFLSVCGLP